MCDAGRIRHHLKHNLWYPESSIVFAGYQAEATLGRALIDGTSSVKLFGETIDVRAHIDVISGLSSHADIHGLLEWIKAFEKKPHMVMILSAISLLNVLPEKWGLKQQLLLVALYLI